MPPPYLDYYPEFRKLTPVSRPGWSDFVYTMSKITLPLPVVLSLVELKPVPLEIKHEEIAPSTALITLSGRLMLGPEGQLLENTVTDLLAGGYRKFVFDLAGVTHIDSTGIGRCIASLNKIMASGGKLHMAAAARQVRDGFHVTRLDRIFKFFDDVAAARAAIQ